MSVIIKWHTKHDDRVCPICKAIDNYEFGPYTEVPNNLVHPTYGEVWNVTLGSLAHEHKLHKGSKYGLLSDCRCSIEPQFDLKDLAKVIHQLRNDLMAAVEEEQVDDTKGGSYRKTTFEDIGIDPSKYGFE